MFCNGLWSEQKLGCFSLGQRNMVAEDVMTCLEQTGKITKILIDFSCYMDGVHFYPDVYLDRTWLMFKQTFVKFVMYKVTKLQEKPWEEIRKVCTAPQYRLVYHHGR